MADPDLHIRGEGVGKGGGGGGHPDPEIRRGRVFFFKFRPLGSQFALKIRGGLSPSPGSATE